jgi:hypothetical protein
MDVKIGRSTDIDSRLSQYQTGNMNVELFDMWKPNPEKTLSTTERGVQAVAEKYAYDSQSEKYVFLQDGYQQFAEIINKLLKNVTREDLDETDESVTEEAGTEDYTGKTPAVIKISALNLSFARCRIDISATRTVKRSRLLDDFENYLTSNSDCPE